MKPMSAEEFRAKMERWVRVMPREVERGMLRAANIARTEAVTAHLSGPKMPVGVGSPTRATLARRSGDLAGSIFAEARRDGGRITGVVGSRGVVYAAIHEFGGVIRAANGAAIVMPERSYLRSSIASKAREIVDAISDSVMEGHDGR